MANEYIAKDYDGGAIATTLNGAISGAVTSITVTAGSTWPDGSGGSFVAVIDRGLGTEEKILITSRAGNILTVSERGYDGTVGQAHADLATIEHCIDAYTLNQANAMATAMTTAGDMLYKTTTGDNVAYGRIGIGAANRVLRSTGSAPAWGQVEIGDVAAALIEVLCPAGTVSQYLGSTAPTGWLFHNQAVGSCDTNYPTLWAKAPTSWKSGTTLNIPNLADVVLMQQGTTALGASGGANSRTIAEANLPSHAHTSGSLAPSGHSITPGNHTHNITDPGHAHIQSVVANATGGLNTRADFTTDTTTGGIFTQTGIATADNTTGISVNSASATVTIGNHSMSGSTGSIGSGTALDTTPKHLGVNIMIKAH